MEIKSVMRIDELKIGDENLHEYFNCFEIMYRVNNLDDFIESRCGILSSNGFPFS